MQSQSLRCRWSPQRPCAPAPALPWPPSVLDSVSDRRVGCDNGHHRPIPPIGRAAFLLKLFAQEVAAQFPAHGSAPAMVSTPPKLVWTRTPTVHPPSWGGRRREEVPMPPLKPSATVPVP